MWNPGMVDVLRKRIASVSSGGSSNQSREYLIPIVLLLVGAGMRAVGLTNWSLSGDDVFTFQELRSFTGKDQYDHTSQIYRLPRLLPVAYTLINLGVQTFGENELGGRIASVILGALVVPAVYLVLLRQFGFVPAIVAALLLAIWPAHISASLAVRFYAPAAFFAYLAILCGALACEYSSNRWLGASLALAILAVLSHTLTLFIFPMIVCAVIAATWSNSRFLPPGFWKLVASGAALLLALALFHVLPLANGWNSGSDWGLGTGHALLNLANALGWPLALLLLLGTAFAVVAGTGREIYWLVCLLGLGSAVIIFPKLVVYHGGYVIPYTLSAIVLIAYGVGCVFAALRSRGMIVCLAWLALPILVNAPSLVSYLLDGSRVDIKSASTFVRQRWQAGDTIATVSGNIFAHYQPNLKPMLWIAGDASAIPQIEKLAKPTGRVWVIVSSDSRRGLDTMLQSWLFANTRHVHQQGDWVNLLVTR